MPDISTLKNQYFVQSNDAEPPERPVPETYEDCEIEPLLDAEAFFGNLQDEIDNLHGDEDEFLYLSGWVMDLVGYEGPETTENTTSSSGFITDTPFSLKVGGPELRAVLKDKADDGVDVRVLYWVSRTFIRSLLAQEMAQGFANQNLATIHSVIDLRGKKSLAKKCCLNTIGHAAGATHAKLAVLGTTDNPVAYTGGLDFQEARRDDTTHSSFPGYHDVQAKITGPAVQSVYDLFRDMWNEVLAQDQRSLGVLDAEERTWTQNYVTGTEEVPERELSPPSTGSKHHVQALRTLPQKNYPKISMFRTDTLSFAPNGAFEAATAWVKAIGNATEYVYIEDQSFWSMEIFEALSQQLQAESDLKVILVWGRVNPNAAPLGDATEAAIWEHFTSELNDGEKERVGMYVRDSMKVHSKTTIVDDEWALIGSTNCTRRSLYTDIEHSIGILDENEDFVPDYRTSLWGDVFDLDPSNRSTVADLQEALYVWNDQWGRAGAGASLPSSVTPIDVDDAEETETGVIYDRFFDPDSREVWRVI